jgi:polysaccharide biosynthesis transport protein
VPTQPVTSARHFSEIIRGPEHVYLKVDVMLQRTGSIRWDNSRLRDADVLSLAETFSSLRALVLRQYPMMLLVLLSCLALAGGYFATAPAKFSSMAELIVDSRKSQQLQQQSPLGVEVPLDSATVDSQVEVLKSEGVALTVIKDLHLTDDPEFTGPPGGPLGKVIALVSELLLPGGEKSDYELTRKALDRFQDRLDVKRRGMSYVIEVNFESVSPQRAAQVANAVANAYISDSLKAKSQASRVAAGWLQDRMKELRTQASGAERQVADFKAKNNIVDTGGRLLNEQRLAELNSSLTMARTQREEAEARAGRIGKILASDDKDVLANDQATVTDSLRNDVITHLRQQYFDLATRQAEWSGRYGPDHKAVVLLNDQMREIRKGVHDELRRIAETYKSDLEIAKAREASAQKILDETIAQSNDTSQAQITLRDLDSDAQSSRALADNFLQLYMVSTQQQSLPGTEARLITQASVPLNRSKPKLWLVALIGVVGGGLLAFAAGLFRDSVDRAFRTGRQIETLLGVNCIAAVQRVGGVADAASAKAVVRRPALPDLPAISDATSLVPADQDGRRSSSRGGNLIRYRTALQGYVVNFPFTRFTEAMRTIKMAADLNELGSPHKIVGVTSSLPNEGKSTIGLSLAQSCAQAGARTLLIDCDVRNPSLTGRLAPDAKRGLLEVMRDPTTINDVVWVDPSTRMSFLPCVINSRLANAGETLGSEAMARLFERLRQSYDRVIVDLSPLAPVADVRATAKLVDSYVLVVEWAQTKIDVVEYALADAPTVADRLLGVVLNKVDIGVMSRYDSHRGNYYRNESYKRYGYAD